MWPSMYRGLYVCAQECTRVHAFHCWFQCVWQTFHTCATLNLSLTCTIHTYILLLLNLLTCNYVQCRCDFKCTRCACYSYVCNYSMFKDVKHLKWAKLCYSDGSSMVQLNLRLDNTHATWSWHVTFYILHMCKHMSTHNIDTVKPICYYKTICEIKRHTALSNYIKLPCIQVDGHHTI